MQDDYSDEMPEELSKHSLHKSSVKQDEIEDEDDYSDDAEENEQSLHKSSVK